MSAALRLTVRKTAGMNKGTAFVFSRGNKKIPYSFRYRFFGDFV
jgi:hypothetical protein